MKEIGEDLAYISERILAMSFPARDLEERFNRWDGIEVCAGVDQHPLFPYNTGWSSTL